MRGGGGRNDEEHHQAGRSIVARIKRAWTQKGRCSNQSIIGWLALLGLGRWPCRIERSCWIKVWAREPPPPTNFQRQSSNNERAQHGYDINDCYQLISQLSIVWSVRQPSMKPPAMFHLGQHRRGQRASHPANSPTSSSICPIMMPPSITISPLPSVWYPASQANAPQAMPCHSMGSSQPCSLAPCFPPMEDALTDPPTLDPSYRLRQASCSIKKDGNGPHALLFPLVCIMPKRPKTCMPCR